MTDAPLPENLLEHIGQVMERDTGTDLIVEDVFTDEVWFPLQRRNELRWMLRLAKQIEAQTIFEIGADKAGTLYHWCRLGTVKRVIACEVRGTPYSRLFEEEFPNISFLWLPESSYTSQALQKVRSFLDGVRLDVLFIDGDKSHFTTDFQMYAPLCGPGSIVFMHDIYDFPGPGDSFREISQHREALRIVDTTESVEAYIRGMQDKPILNSHEAWLRHWKGQSAGAGAIFL